MTKDWNYDKWIMIEKLKYEIGKTCYAVNPNELKIEKVKIKDFFTCNSKARILCIKEKDIILVDASLVTNTRERAKFILDNLKKGKKNVRAKR